jgi:hypothetical protein
MPAHGIYRASDNAEGPDKAQTSEVLRIWGASSARICSVSFSALTAMSLGATDVNLSIVMRDRYAARDYPRWMLLPRYLTAEALKARGSTAQGGAKRNPG